MTLGERIQSLRKTAGLSQEELGEKLGVARQSVSKWESEATIPELDKLIAMSKLFGVPIGALLGLEEQEGPDHELTQRELKALEAIAAKLTPAEEPKPAKRRRLWPWILGGAAACVAVMVLVGRISSMENQISGLHYNISNVENSVVRQINSLTGQVQTILEEQNDVTAGKDYQILEMDLSENRVLFSLTATPKEYQEGMTAVFSATGPDFEGVEIPGVPGAGQSFSAELSCPLSDGIILSVAFVKDGVTLNQQLGQEWSLRSNTELSFNGHLGWTISSSGDKYTITRLTASLHGVTPGQYKTAEGWMDLKPVKGSLRLWKNDTLFWSEERAEMEEGRVIEDLAIPTEGLDLAPGDRLILSILYTDTAGREREAFIDGCLVEEDGQHMEPVAPYSEGWENNLPF